MTEKCRNLNVELYLKIRGSLRPSTIKNVGSSRYHLYNANLNYC